MLHNAQLGMDLGVMPIITYDIVLIKTQLNGIIDIRKYIPWREKHRFLMNHAS